MNHPFRFCLSLLLAGGATAALPAQDTPPAAPADDSFALSSSELDDLLGPIALYPDDLIALILPASTQTTDIVLAARYLENEGAMDKIDDQPWDDAVRAIAHFPDVVEWMSKNLSWTEEVGDAFLLQPADVMKSVQRLRSKAYAAGTLRDTEQQKVLVDGDVIRIVSAQDDVIYVPRYRTEVVYVDRPVYYSEPWITFGIGWHVGRWHRWSCDWSSHRIWVFDHHDHWWQHRRHRFHVGIHFHSRHYHHGRAWYPPRHHVRSHHHRYRHWDRDDRGHRRFHRPGPYVENDRHRRDRDRNRDSGHSRLDRARREQVSGGNSERFDRHERERDHSRRRQGDMVNQPNRPPRPSPGSIANGRRDHNPAIDRTNDAGRGDRRNLSRGSRNESPRRPSVVVNRPPASPPPAVGSSRANDSSRRGSVDRARQQRSGSGGESSRTVRAYAPQRASAPPAASSATRSTRSEPSRASVAPPPRPENRAANASASRSSGNSSGHSRVQASRSSYSRDADSNGSKNSGRNDRSGGEGRGRGR